MSADTALMDDFIESVHYLDEVPDWHGARVYDDEAEREDKSAGDKPGHEFRGNQYVGYHGTKSLEQAHQMLVEGIRTFADLHPDIDEIEKRHMAQSVFNNDSERDDFEAESKDRNRSTFFANTPKGAQHYVYGYTQASGLGAVLEVESPLDQVIDDPWSLDANRVRGNTPPERIKRIAVVRGKNHPLEFVPVADYLRTLGSPEKKSLRDILTTLDPWLVDKAQAWNESQHPRGKAGEFASKDSGSVRAVDLSTPQDIVFHGTSAEYLDSILKEGLKPGSANTRLFPDAYYKGDRGQAVYATAMPDDAVGWAHQAAYSIAHAEAEKVTAHSDPKYNDKVTDRFNELARKARLVVFTVDTSGTGFEKDSEAHEDAAAYYHVGTIPPSAIKSYSVYDYAGVNLLKYVELKSQSGVMHVPTLIFVSNNEPNEKSAAFDPNKHPRGNPKNRGEFAKKDAQSFGSEPEHEPEPFDPANPFGDWGESSSGKLIGYRGVGSGGTFGNSEGDGTYIAKTEELAQFFGDPIKVQFDEPKKPLVVNREPMYILIESDELERPVSKTDSEWLKFSKQAYAAGLKATGGKYTNDTAESTGHALTQIVRGHGYDSIYVNGDDDRSWLVLFHEGKEEKSITEISPSDELTAAIAQALREVADIIQKSEPASWSEFVAARGADEAWRQLADYRRNYPTAAVEILRAWITQKGLQAEYEVPLFDGAYATAMVWGKAILVNDGDGLDLGHIDSPHVMLTAKSLLDGSFEEYLPSLIEPAAATIREVPVEVIREVEVVKQVEVVRDVVHEVAVIKSQDSSGPMTFQFKRGPSGVITGFSRLLSGQRTDYAVKRNPDGGIVEVQRSGSYGPVRFFFTRNDDTLTVRREMILAGR